MAIPRFRDPSRLPFGSSIKQLAGFVSGCSGYAAPKKDAHPSLIVSIIRVPDAYRFHFAAGERFSFFYSAAAGCIGTTGVAG